MRLSIASIFHQLFRTGESLRRCGILQISRRSFRLAFRFSLWTVFLQHLPVELRGADITWGPATASFGISDVSTAGVLVEAWNLGGNPAPATTVNGVPFQSFVIPSLPSSLGRLKLETSGSFFTNSTSQNFTPGTPIANVPAEYRVLLIPNLSVSPGATLTLSNLTPGARYAIQLWSCAQQSTIDVRVTFTAGTVVTLQANPGNMSGGLGEFAVGTFTADAATQSIGMAGMSNIGPLGTISAVQLRLIAEAPSLVVTTAADVVDPTDGQTSLREAIVYANSQPGDDIITFSDSTANGATNFHDGGVRAITLASALPNLSDSATVSGPGANVLTVARSSAVGTPDFRIFTIGSGKTVSISGLTISNGKVSGNSVNDRGAGIANFGTLTVQRSIISNHFNAGIGSGGLGGGIYNGGTMTLENSTVGNNSALSSGGGISNLGTLTVRSSILNNNVALFGGGIANTGTLTVENSTLSNNSSTDTNTSVGGGGIYNSAGSLTVVNSTLSNNSALRGGGIYSASTPYVVGQPESATRMLLRNSTISGNSASIAGGGVYIAQGLSSIENCTIAGNSAPLDAGSGVFSSGFNFTLTRVRNSIIADNRTSLPGSPDSGHDVFFDNTTNSFVSLGFNLIGDGTGAGNFTATGDQTSVTAAQLKLAPLADNGGPTLAHALLPGSPAIDAGDPAFDPDAFTPALTTDQRGAGFARVVKGNATSPAARVDIGAFELFAAPSLTVPALNVLSSDGPVDLAVATGASPGGGTFGGPGVTNGSLDPAGLAPGIHTLTYTITDPQGVSNVASFTVTVSNAVEVEVNAAGLLTMAENARVFQRSSTGVVTGPLTAGSSVVSPGSTILIDGISAGAGPLESVEIRNLSDRDLAVGAINCVSGGGAGSATPITIRNARSGATPASAIIFEGGIQNPLGMTVIDNQRGDIRAAADPVIHRIQTNILSLNADTGSMGSADERLEIELVESDTRPMAVSVEAKDDAWLSVTALRRSAATGAFAVSCGFLHAGGDLDLMIEDSVAESPNGLGGSAATGTNRILIGSDYLFPDLAAGGTIALRHPSEATTVTFTATADTDAALTDTASLGVTATGATLSTSDGAGKIEVDTNGFVWITESAGSLLAGSIASRSASVQLDVPDKDGGEENLLVQADAAIAAGTTVLLQAGDGVTFPASATLTAGTTATIRGDFNNSGTPGATVSLLGAVTAADLSVHLENHDGFLILDRSLDPTPTVAHAHGQRGSVNVRGNQGSLECFSVTGPTTFNVGSTAAPPAFNGSAVFNAGARTINGSFGSAGIVAGQTIRVTGTVNNNGTYLVQAANGSTLTLSSDSVLTSESAPTVSIFHPSGVLTGCTGAIRLSGSPNANDTLNVDAGGSTSGASMVFTGDAIFSSEDSSITRTSGSFLADGFAVGQIIGVMSPLNAGFYTITTVSATRLTVNAPLESEQAQMARIAASSGIVESLRIMGLGLGPEGVQHSSMQFVNVFLGTGDDACAVFDPGSSPRLVVDGGGGSNDLIGALSAQDWTGDVTLRNAEQATGNVGRDFAGFLRIPGDLAKLAIGRDLNSGIVLLGNAGIVSIGRNQSQTAQLNFPADVGQVRIGGSQSGLISVGRHATTVAVAEFLNPAGRLNVTGSLGNLLVTSSGAVGTSGLNGRVVIGGSLGSLEVNGDVAGNIAVGGDVGQVLNADGSRLERVGQLLVTGNFTGRLVTTGNVLADTLIGGDLTGRWAARGRTIPGLADPDRTGFLGAITVNGSISATAAIASSAQLGDSVPGNPVSAVRAPGISGILASVRGMVIGNAPGSLGPPPINFSNIFADLDSDPKFGGLFGPINGGSGGNSPASHTINAIFTNGGIQLYIDPTPLGQAYTNLILIDLASLTAFGRGTYPPRLISSSTVLLKVGDPGTFTPLSSENGTITLEGDLPPGVVFANGMISGTPDSGSGGIYQLKLSTTNGVAPGGMQDLVLTVNEDPSILAGGTLVAGLPGSIPVALGFPTPGVTISTSLPSGLELRDGFLTGTPDASGVGVHTLSATANNGTGPDVTGDFVLTIAEPPSLTVTTAADIVDPTDGQTSLREALAHAATLTGPQTITFSATTANGAVNFHDGTARSITLNGTQLAITSDLTLTGPGADRLAISGNDLSRVAWIAASARATLAGLTLKQGKLRGSFSGTLSGAGLLNEGDLTLRRVVVSDCRVILAYANTGGGIHNAAGATLAVLESVIRGNTAVSGAENLGGGIYNAGTLSLTASTVADNLAGEGRVNRGGGLYNAVGAVAEVVGTLSSNTTRGASHEAVQTGAGIHNAGALTLFSSTLAGNAVAPSRGGSDHNPFTIDIYDLDAQRSTHFPVESEDPPAFPSAQSSGGGLFNAGTVDQGNTLVATNSSAGDSPDVSGTIGSRGFNLIGLTSASTGWLASDQTGVAAPLLGLLQDNGGPTPTHALLPGSPAIDAGGMSEVQRIDANGESVFQLSFNGQTTPVVDTSGTAEATQTALENLSTIGLGNVLVRKFGNGPSARFLVLFTGALEDQNVPQMTGFGPVGVPLIETLVEGGSAPDFDQRGPGYPRVTKGLATSSAPRVDIGAYELFAAPTFTNDALTLATGSAPLDLGAATGVSPAGGTFSGTGVDNGAFDPTGLALGPYTVTYTVSDAFGATNSATFTVTVAEVPSLTVTTTSDSSTNTDGQTSLREAMTYAATLTGPQTITFTNSTANGAVNFHDGTARTIELVGKLPDIGRSSPVVPLVLSINGPGEDLLTIERPATAVTSFGIFTVSFNNRSEIRGLTISGAAGSPAIYANGSIKLEDCVIRNTTGSPAITVLNGPLVSEILRCRIEDNASNNDSAVNNNGKLNITGTRFLRNRHDDAGALRNSVGAVLQITGCDFEENSGGFGCGALLANGGTITITDSRFVGNSSNNGEGGAIAVKGANLNLHRVRFSGNSSRNGGAIRHGAGDLVAVSCNFSGNRTYQSNGVGGGGAVTTRGRAFFHGCSFVGNETGQDNEGGGAILVERDDHVWISQCTLSGNRVHESSLYGGGGILTFGAVTISQTTITGNAGTPGRNGSDSGIVCLNPESLILANSLIAGNEVPGSGAGDLRNSSPSPWGTLRSNGANFVGTPLVGAFGSGSLQPGDRSFSSTGTTRAEVLAFTAGNHGGLVPTVALAPGSPALDGGGVLASLASPLGAENSATALTLDDVVFLAPVAGATLLRIGDELLRVTAVSGNTLTVERGHAGSPLGAHAVGVPVQHAFDQRGQARVRGRTADIGAFESAPARLYIDQTVTGGDGSGDSWTNAMPELRTATAMAQTDPAVTEIWVARGTYKPAAAGGDREASFHLRSALAIYGGFTSGQTDLDQRDANPETNGTVLSGDLDGNDGANFVNTGDNGFHVVTGSGTDSTAVLDGFAIIGGYADTAVSSHFLGGGMIVDGGSPTLTNLHFSKNFARNGGALCARGPGGPILSRVLFTNNSARFSGGAVYVVGATLRIETGVFEGNRADRGAALLSNVGNVALINATIAGNSADDSVGGIQFDGGTGNVRNSILWGNMGDEIAGSPVVTNSIVEGGYEGALDLDPDFIDAPNRNLRLRSTSPAVNAGDNSVVTATTDLDGSARIIGANVDLGAYELIDTPTLTNTQLSVVNGGSLSDLAALTGASPDGGVFSGNGVALVGDKYVFDSSGIAMGTQVTITYTISGPGGSSNETTFTITVLETPSLTVTTTSDASTDVDGLTSLREAIAYANDLGGAREVTFDPTAFATARSIRLGTDLPEVTCDLTITGTGAEILTISDGSNTGVGGSLTLMSLIDGSLSISGVTLAGGATGLSAENATDLAISACVLRDHGVAVTTGSGVSATILGTTIHGNTTGLRSGGGSTMLAVNLTVADNVTGIANTGTFLARHATITGNDTGLSNEFSATLVNTICAGNVTDVAGSQAITEAGNNLLGMSADDAGLDPVGLRDNGGPTATVRLLPGSPALDAADPAHVLDPDDQPLTSDQRGPGFGRVLKGLAGSATATADIGAFELFAAPEFLTEEFRIQIDGRPLNLAAATGVSPRGGVFSGPGVSGGVFDPRTQRVGRYEIAYTLTGDFGITNRSTFVVVVIADGPRLELKRPRLFPTTNVGRRSKVQRLSLVNRGDLPATGLRVVLRGAGRRDYRVTQPAASTLSPKGKTIFRAMFQPKKAGTRTAKVTILSRGGKPVSATLRGKGRKASTSIRDPARVFPES